MIILKLTPVIISFLILGAHFFRAESLTLAVICCAFPLLLFIRKPWIAGLTQISLAAGSLEWIRTLCTIAESRQAFGQPWGKAAIILGAVALFTALSTLAFKNRSIKKRYGLL